MQSNFFDKSRTATIRIPRVFEEFLQSLADAKVRYLLIDGFAVSFHVRPRPTEDLDVWIELSEVNADAVVDAFDRFGLKMSIGMRSSSATRLRGRATSRCASKC